MKKILITLMVLVALVVSAEEYSTITCNDGDFTTTNIANQKVTYSGQYGSVTIMPEDGIVISDVTFTNSAAYALTNAAYSIGATIPLNDTQLPLKGVHVPYTAVNFYVQSTGATAVVNFIWHD